MQTIRRTSGVSLLEVLAAIFVVSIGLLGVLAVIPFGAFQVSKAQHAEYASNMLVNAAEEIFIRKMPQPIEWGHPSLASGGETVFVKVDPPESSTFNCTKFIWVEPWGMRDPDYHIFCINSFVPLDKWDEVMRGQDDLDYTIHPDKRPELKFNKEGKPLSSGKYTWFFTYLPTTTETSKAAVLLANVNSPVVVDVLACYNRVASDDRQVSIPSERFVPANGGGTFTLPNTDYLELLTQTKYVFVTWGPPTQVAGGTWCKIVFVDKSNPVAPKLIVTGALPNRIRENRFIQVYIPSGVLYHKRLEDVPIK